VDIVTREEAVKRGMRRYFTGEPCSRGHISIRRTVNFACEACVKEYRDAKKERYRKNRDAAILATQSVSQRG